MNRGERWHELPDPQLFPSSAELVAIGTVHLVAEVKMTFFPFQLLTTKNCSKWERSSVVFACRMLVIASPMASSSSEMSATSLSPSRRNRQTNRLNLNCCG
jgi:hypothetical protein